MTQTKKQRDWITQVSKERSAESNAVAKHIKKGQILVSTNPKNYGLELRMSSFAHNGMQTSYIYELKLQDIGVPSPITLVYLKPCECDRCRDPFALSYHTVLHTHIEAGESHHQVFYVTSGAITDALNIKVDIKKYGSEYGNEL
jgi:hypothetical protein